MLEAGPGRAVLIGASILGVGASQVSTLAGHGALTVATAIHGLAILVITLHTSSEMLTEPGREGI